MAGPIYYSTNPWIAHDFATKYLGGVHFAWVCEYFDAGMAPPGTAAAAIAPSSNPKNIYHQLATDVEGEDVHSSLIKSYQKTFRRLSVQWHAVGKINLAQKDEMMAIIGSKSWKIWRPILYAIPKAGIAPARLITVPHKLRAALGPEMQIVDLMPHEFDIIEFKK
ncbi:hypothetical protein [Polaromonas sp. P5_D5]